MSYFRVAEGRTLEEERFIESANFGDSEIFGPLLQKFADVRSYYGLERFAKISYFAFQLAAHRGHTDIVDCFCSLPRTCKKAVEELMKVWDFQGAELTSSPLHIAVSEDHVDAVDAVLNFLVKNRRCQPLAHYSFSEWSRYFGGPLKWATRWGHASTIRLVLAHFPKFHYDVLLLFRMAAQHSRVDVLQMFLEEDLRHYMGGTNLNSHSSDGLTALHIAAQFGSYPAVEFLLKQRNINVKKRSDPEGFTPLHMAANSGHVEVVNLLLQKLNHGTSEEAACIDLDLLLARDCIGRTALHYAVRQGHELVVQKLLSCTPQANLASIADYDGFLPLHLAARAGHIGFIRQLRSLHADGINCEAQYATHMKGRVEREYMDAGRAKNSYHGEKWEYPRPRLVDSFFWKTKGFTPLHLATRYDLPMDVRELLEQPVPDPSREIVEDHAGPPEAVSFCKSNIDEEAKAMEELRHAWHTGTRPPLKVHIVQMLEADAEIGSVRKYWLSRAVRTVDLDLFRRLLLLFTDFQAKDGDDNKYDCRALQNEAVREAFHQLAFTRYCSDVSIRVMITELLLLPAINEEEIFTVLLEALENSSCEAAKELLLQVPQVDVRKTALLKSGVDSLILEALQNRLFSDAEERLLQAPQLRDFALAWGVEIWIVTALENESFQAAKTILLQMPQVGLRDNALARIVERWIVESNSLQLGKGKRFLMALVTREGLVGAPSLLRQMLPRAREAEMEDLVGVIMDRPELKRSLYEDRQVYLDCANAILVGAALIVGIAVQGWLQPPLGYSYAYEEEQYVDVHKPLMRVFWKFNNAAFFLAVGALIAGAKGAVPVARETDILKSVEKVKRAVAVASTFLGGALVCLVVAFAAAGFVVLPPDHGSDYRMMRNGVIWGAIPCGLVLLWFCRSVLPLLLYLLKHLHNLVWQAVYRTFKVLSGQSPERLARIFWLYGRLDVLSLKSCIRYICYGDLPF